MRIYFRDGAPKHGEVKGFTQGQSTSVAEPPGITIGPVPVPCPHGSTLSTQKSLAAPIRPQHYTFRLREVEISLKTPKPWSPTPLGQVGHVHEHLKVFWDQPGGVWGQGSCGFGQKTREAGASPLHPLMKSAELELSLPSPPSRPCHEATKMSPLWSPLRAG